MGKRYLLLFVFCALLLISFARAWTRPSVVESVPKPGFEPRSRSSIPYLPTAVLSNDITFFGGTTWAADSMRWEAVKDSVWTFDSGVGSAIIQPGNTYPGVNPFKPVGFHAFMEGWVGVDNTYGKGDSYFRRISSTDPRWGPSVCVGTAGGLGESYSFWAGVFPSEADSLCYPAGQGYGNTWNLCIQQTFAYTGGSVTLDYDYANETESGYDFSTVQVEGGGTVSEVASYDGSAWGHETILLTAGTELPIPPDSVSIRFCFDSDPAWSDEDGLNPTTCGAFAVDNISLTGGIVYATDFELDDGGWSLLPPRPGAGDFSRLVSVNDLPGVPGNVSGNCSLSDSVLVFFDPATNGHPLDQHNLVLSPWIDLERAGMMGMPGKTVHYEGYFDLPFTDYILGRAAVQWFPDTCQVSNSVGLSSPAYSPFFHFNTPTCRDDTSPPIDMSTLIPAEATQVRIGLEVVNYCRFFGDCTGLSNTTPWFDNIRFGVAPFLGLQDLIDSAAPGDTILVPAGTYSGAGNKNLDFGGKNLVMLAPSGPDSTIIDCQGSGRGFIFQSGEDSTSIVDGFTIQNGDTPLDEYFNKENGGGILIRTGSRPTIQNCTITWNKAGNGGGIYAESGAKVILCSITNNTAERWDGGGIGGQAFIDQCAITDNTASGYGGGVSLPGGTILKSSVLRNQADSGGGIAYGTVIDCVVSNNSGGGIFLASPVEGCLITGNTANSGGGVFLSGTMTDCMISDNVASNAGGGVYLGRSTMERCTIIGNSAPNGGGIHAVPLGSSSFGVGVTVIDCIITGNEADQGGGIRTALSLPHQLSLTGSTVSGNHALEGGGIYILARFLFNFPPSIVISTNSIVWGNCVNGPGGGQVVLADTLSSIQFTCSAIDTTGIEGDGTVQYLGPQVFTDPQFCDPKLCQHAPSTEGDYRLIPGSPCLPASSPCGSLIGALGVGCSTTTGLPDDSTRERPLLTVFPNPFSSFLNMNFSIPPGVPAEVRIFDVAGRMIRELPLDDQARAAVWDGTDRSNRKVGIGVYFLQLRAGPHVQTVRVVRIPE